MTTRLEHAQILVEDLERSAAFYLKVFPDWRVRARGRELGEPKYSWIHVGTDDSYVALRRDEGKIEKPANAQTHIDHIGIAIDDAPATLRALSEIGAKIKVFDHPYRTRIYTQDPDGHGLELVAYLTDDPRLKNDYKESVAAGTSVIDED